MRNLDPGRRRWMKARIFVLCGGLALAAGAVVQRAYTLQIRQAPELRAQAEQQQLRDVHLAPKRGTIYDRHGAELAVSVGVESVFANPRQMRREHVDIGSAAARLAALLGVDRERLFARFSGDRHFAWVARQVTPHQAESVRALAIPGIALTHESRRFYPNRGLAAQVLGFSNVDGVGIEGLELSMEERLHGSLESVPAMVDRRGQVVFSEQLLDDRAAQGDDLYLTLDKTIQHIAEHELSMAVRTFEGESGSVVVMDPNTGEILALANYPTFDPNDPGGAPPSHRRNRALTDRFEPGSTIKTFTIAAAIAAGTLRADEGVDCSGDAPHNRLIVDEDGHTIGEAEGHRFDRVMSPAEILAHSSNIGAARIGIGLGRNALYRGLRRFGFGQSTGLPLPGETAGLLRHPDRWYSMDLASVSFGHGLSVTTMQLAVAYTAIANGGRLLQPTLIRRVVDGRGETLEEASPQVRRQVVPRSTARVVSDMLTGVTGDAGTGVEAAIDGFIVAGKTGTAQRADDEHGGYDEGAFTSSFVGFVPAEAPRLVIAVVVDEPMISHFGGVVAGPVFRRIGEAALRHLGTPASGGGEILVQMDRARRQRAREARAAGRAPATHGPDAGEAPVEVEGTQEEGQARVPDLRGVSARGALVALANAGFVGDLEGTGLVTTQTPSPGTLAPAGSSVQAVLEAPRWHASVLEPTEDEPSGERAEASVGATAAAGVRGDAREVLR